MRKILLFALVLWIGTSCERPAGRLAILMYHHVTVDSLMLPHDRAYAVTPEQFAAHMDALLAGGFMPVTLSEVEHSHREGTPLPARAVLVTFDDGYSDNFDNAFPVLLERRIPVAIFLITDYAGDGGWVMDWAEIDSMRHSGLVEFASHGAVHERMRALTGQQALDDLTRSRRTLEEHFGRRVESYAYPYGCTGGKEKRALVFEAGYMLDFGVKEGVNHWPWDGRKPLLRYGVGEDMTPEKLLLLLEK